MQFQRKSEVEYQGKENILSLQYGYPVFTARKFGVTRKELKKALSVCLIGKVVDVERENKLERLKQGVEITLETLGEIDQSESTSDFSDQLNRWLQEYPNVQLYNEPPQTGVDPNAQSFPLPKAILFDPLLMRKWVEYWEPFEVTDVDWPSYDVLNQSLGDTHEVFANLVKSSRDESIEELDMSIEGEAAWTVIEIDLVRYDKTTEEQEKTWRSREKRTNINDPAWQTKRRSEIAHALIARHEMDPNIMTPYLSFCENLEKAWKEFQELCAKDFVPPKRLARDPAQIQSNEAGKKRKSSANSRHSDNSSTHDSGVGHAVFNSTDDVQNDDIPNNERNGSETNIIVEEQNNAFLTLADDEGDEDNGPLVLADDGQNNEPVVLEPITDTDPSVNGPTGIDSSDDQVDDRVQNNDFDRLVRKEPSYHTQEETEQLMNELEFGNNSSDGNVEEF